MPWTLCWRLETSVGWQLKTGLPDLPIRPFECLHCSFGRIFFWQTSRETLEISRYVFSYYQFGIQLGKWILSRPDHSLLRANLTSIFVGHPHRGLSWFRVKLSHSTWWDQTYNNESYIRKISTPCAAFGFFFCTQQWVCHTNHYQSIAGWCFSQWSRKIISSTRDHRPILEESTLKTGKISKITYPQLFRTPNWDWNKKNFQNPWQHLNHIRCRLAPVHWKMALGTVG